MAETPSPGHPALLEKIRREIRASGPISFARFMEHALHDPDHGYYASGEERIGRSGDFFTASDVGDLFGECLARQFEEMDRALGSPRPFAVVEFGAGRGLLAQDVLKAAGRIAPGLADRLDYAMVDRSPGMRRAEGRAAPGARVLTPGGVASAGDGCLLAVELLDALPVHRVRRRKEALREILVALDEGDRLVESEGEPSPEVAAEAVRYGAAAEEGWEAEICLGVGEALDAMGSAVDRGFLVLVDYGYSAAELYGPAHARGTLLAYHRHTTSEDYLARVGEQDLTAHVNLSALDDALEERGWTVLGRTTQDRFLIANGILERFESADEAEYADPDRVRGRMRAMQLIHPEGMGRIFKVVVACRGIDPAPDLAGLRDPFAR